MPADTYIGLLCIGDPHLASRVPGFRKDDYPRVILGKLRWALHYAQANRLLPIILGDLFHYPQDNANWLLVQLLDLFKTPVLAIAGNHDCNENTLTENDTLSILSAAGHLHLLDQHGPWRGHMNNTLVCIGGTPWCDRLPKSLDPSTLIPQHPAPSTPHSALTPPLVFWIAHHDIRFPGYEDAGRFGCFPIPGVDVLINGHIHRPLQEVTCDCTTWLNPGNITRVTRSDGSRNRKPSVLRIDVAGGQWSKQIIEVPHQPFDDVFHPEIVSAELKIDDSLFIRGLAQLESLKTSTGAGLRAFLADNLHQFDEPVANEIRALAQEVLEHGD
ncbi:MAG TPA: metallophosphoesterase [Tepidisphaeraceae bacterium]|nr:metallophosphoesterase [Tepidisphaeraceae bacterium]